VTLPPLLGHEDVRRDLARAIDAGRLPGSLLIHGPPGVGRQRTGLWLAQRLVCESPGDVEPCGRCTPCRLALRLEHPEIHWFFPIPRPKSGGGPEKMVDAVEDARAAALATLRGDPFHRPPGGETVGLYLAQVQAIRRLAAGRPSVGARRVILIGDAELLVPQESSPEAANALLKLLEEPPAATTLILTAASPDGLLATIRSRVLPVRLRRLPADAIAGFLTRHLDAAPGQALTAARLADGSIGRALDQLGEGDAGTDTARDRARRYLEAALAPGRAAGLAAAHALPPSGARGGFAESLDYLELWIRDLGAVACDAEELVVNQDALPFLRAQAKRSVPDAAGVPDALRSLEEARGWTRTNVNPQLALAALLRGIGEALARP
jgi:DNA polymerase III subunit delta'